MKSHIISAFVWLSILGKGIVFGDLSTLEVVVVIVAIIIYVFTFVSPERIKQL